MFGANTIGISCAAASMALFPLRRESGGADDQADLVAPAGREMLQRALRPGEVDQAIGNLQRGIEIGRDPDTAGGADQFAGILAEERTAAVFKRSGKAGAGILLHGLDQGTPHATRTAGNRIANFFHVLLLLLLVGIGRSRR
jgi:hypothetical protein